MSLHKVVQWWEIRRNETPATTVRLYVFRTKKEALKQLRASRREHPENKYWLCRTREHTEIEFRPD